MSNSLTVETDQKTNTDRTEKVIAILQRLAENKSFCPKMMEMGFKLILKLNPSFATVEKVCKVTNSWYEEFGPDPEWGWFDNVEIPMEHFYACRNLWAEMSQPIVENAGGFYAVLETLKHISPRETYRAQDKMAGFASTPEHALAWLELNNNRNITLYSKVEQEKFFELATTDEVRLEMLRQGAFSSEILRRLHRELRESTNPVTKFALRLLESRR